MGTVLGQAKRLLRTKGVCPQLYHFSVRVSAPLKNSPEAGGKINVGEFGSVREHRPYLGFAVTGYAVPLGTVDFVELNLLFGYFYDSIRLSPPEPG